VLKRIAWTVAVVACLSIGAAAVADSGSLGDQAQPCPGIHSTLHIDRQLGATVHAMWHRSPTFRRQMSRLSLQPGLDTRLTIWSGALSGNARAETLLRRRKDGLRMATIRIKLPTGEETIVELIAHELEHIVEQLDGVNLQLTVDRYGTGHGIRRGPRGSFETERAQRVGLAVRAEYLREPRATPCVEGRP
jgi:hypothetical protein